MSCNAVESRNARSQDVRFVPLSRGRSELGTGPAVLITRLIRFCLAQIELRWIKDQTFRTVAHDLIRRTCAKSISRKQHVLVVFHRTLTFN